MKTRIKQEEMQRTKPENGGGLFQLDVEGRLAGQNAIVRANASENAILKHIQSEIQVESSQETILSGRQTTGVRTHFSAGT